MISNNNSTGIDVHNSSTAAIDKPVDLPKKPAGSIESLSSASTLSEKELNKLNSYDNQERKKKRKEKSRIITDWAANVNKSLSSVEGDLSSSSTNKFVAACDKPKMKVSKNLAESPSKVVKPIVTQNKIKKQSAKFKQMKALKSNTRKDVAVKKEPLNKLQTASNASTVNVPVKLSEGNLTPAMSDVIKKRTKKLEDAELLAINKSRYAPYRKVEGTCQKSIKPKTINKIDKRNTGSKVKTTNVKTKNDLIAQIMDKSEVLPVLKPLEPGTRIPRVRRDSGSSNISRGSKRSYVSSCSHENPFFEKQISFSAGDKNFGKKPEKLKQTSSSVFSPSSTKPIDFFKRETPVQPSNSFKHLIDCNDNNMQTQQSSLMDSNDSFENHSIANTSNRNIVQTFNGNLQCSFRNNSSDAEEGMEIDDAVEMSREIMKEVTVKL